MEGPRQGLVGWGGGGGSGGGGSSTSTRAGAWCSGFRSKVEVVDGASGEQEFPGQTGASAGVRILHSHSHRPPPAGGAGSAAGLRHTGAVEYRKRRHCEGIKDFFVL